MRRRSRIRAALVAPCVSLAVPAVAQAHGIQGRADVPVPLVAFYWAAAAVLVVSFVGLAVGWRRPLLARALARGKTIDAARDRRWVRVLGWVAGAVSFVLLALVFATAAFGSTELNDNPAPIAVFVVWWIMAPVLAAIGPDWWRVAHPVGWLARVLGVPSRRAAWPRRRGVWFAVVGILVFDWLELVYPTGADVHLIAALVAGWSVVTLAGMVTWGVDTWLDHGEPFTVYTGLVHRLSPVHVGRTADGRLRLVTRRPLAGLSAMPTPPGTVALVCLLIGTVSYDGLSRTVWWKLRLGNGSARLAEHGFSADHAQQVFGTFGLVTMSLIALGAFLAAAELARLVGRLPRRTRFGSTPAAFAPSLVPIALAYVVAHYASYVWYQSQRLIPLASDPFGTGANLFGTLDYAIDYSTLSSNAIWAIQIGAIVVGHVLGLVLAHDRALEIEADHPASRGVRSQWPMLALMVLYTVGGLYFLSEGLNA
ncbi:MAG: fenitrothion hydrolase [Thermoleophilia bacterium]|nr:fenitrothion hydrolase [Thermoleophilia bacterium]